MSDDKNKAASKYATSNIEKKEKKKELPLLINLSDQTFNNDNDNKEVFNLEEENENKEGKREKGKVNFSRVEFNNIKDTLNIKDKERSNY